MREIRTPGSMSGEEKRSDGLLGETSNERRWPLSAPPVLYATALLLDSTTCIRNLSYRLRFSRRIDPDLVRRTGDLPACVDEAFGMALPCTIQSQLPSPNDSVGAAVVHRGWRQPVQTRMVVDVV